MSLIKLALRRIAIRNLDKTIVKSFNNIVKPNQENKIKDYCPKIPKFSDIFKSIGMSILILLGVATWSSVLYLILLIFLSSKIAIIISLTIMILLLFILFIAEISIMSVPSTKQESLFVEDNRYKDKKRFIKYIDIPDHDNMIFFNKGQNIIKIISSLILYLPSIISIILFVLLYFN